MGGKFVNLLIGAAGFALIVVLIARFETAPLISFLLIFALTFVSILAAIALRDVEGELGVDQEDPKMPAGFGQALLEKMSSALILINDKGRITYANSAAKSLVPRLRKGNHFANLFRAPIFVEAVNEVLLDGHEQNMSFSLPGQDRVFVAHILALPPGSDLGEDHQVIVQIEDRTQDKRSEAMRSDFIANASHELRTPLASIIGYIETLQGHARLFRVSK